MNPGDVALRALSRYESHSDFVFFVTGARLLKRAAADLGAFAAPALT